ncbi:hypothetical protein [Polaribacter sp. SA4-10]|uniref:hypothetical protein n=1 Tax=Polaribacter sp. SA4-10 TaxID=754397 RepID=UPI0012F9BC3A|nr:hypothetical protein [Polaribacter sp. SA4-10]
MMHKEQNVIKILLTVVVFCLSSNLYCQKKIIGRYSSLMAYQEHYNYFDFNENGIFEYHSGASLGDDEYGKGQYTIKNDSLILNYNLTELKYESYFKAKKYYNSKDSIKVNMKVYNFNIEPLDNIMVYSFPNYKSTESNKQGKTFLKFKKGSHKDKIKLHIEGAFWAKQVLYLDGDSNYNLEIFMNKSDIIGFGHPRAIKNQIIKYKIVEQTDDFIKLKKNSGIIKLVKQSE